jgi:hypothetical protein
MCKSRGLSYILQNILQYITKVRDIYTYITEIEQNLGECTVYKTNHLFYFVFFGLFQNRSVCFGCFDIDPKHRNEPKQTEKIIYWFRETNNRNRLGFGLFRFEPKIYFVCFENTLVVDADPQGPKTFCRIRIRIKFKVSDPQHCKA